MAATPQGPGWWQATDGQWYPPETHPEYQAPPPPPTPPPTPPPVALAPYPTAPVAPWAQPQSVPPFGTPPATDGKASKKAADTDPGQIAKGIAALVAIGIAIAVWINIGNHPTVDLEGKLTTFEVVDPGTLNVSVVVTNNQDKTVQDVRCGVVMGEGAYTGDEVFFPADEKFTLSPGGSRVLAGPVAIAGDGAIWVKTGTVNCMGDVQ